jgi:hypothetical protein
MVRTTNLVIDIMLPFITNKKLIEGLARSEIKSFREGTRGAQNIKWILKFGETEVTLGGDEDWFDPGQQSNRLNKQSNEISKMPLIGIPGGYLGIQAFYLILENFWRNLAKHNRIKVEDKLRNGNLEIYIEIKENPKDTCFWKVSLWADVEIEKGIAEKIRKILENKKGAIIDEEGKLIPEGWGIKEMLVGAGYLRGSKLIDLQQKPTEILRCCKKDDKYLCYEFDVLKPMRLFILSDKKIEDNIKRELSAKGVWVGSEIEKDSIIPTEYLIVGPKIKCEIYDSLKPIKSFKFEDLNINELTDGNELNNLLIELEKKFINLLLENTGIKNIQFIIRVDETAYPEDIRLIDNDLENLLNTSHVQDSYEFTLGTQFPDSFDENSLLIIFDRHGAYYNEVQNINKSQLFYEPYEGGSYTAFTLQHGPIDNNEKLI